MTGARVGVDQELGVGVGVGAGTAPPRLRTYLLICYLCIKVFDLETVGCSDLTDKALEARERAPDLVQRNKRRRALSDCFRPDGALKRDV